MGKKNKHRNRQQQLPMLNDPIVLCPFCVSDPGYLTIVKGIFNQNTFLMRESNAKVVSFSHKDSVDHKNQTYTSIWCTKCSFKESIMPNNSESLLKAVDQLMQLSVEAWGPNNPTMTIRQHFMPHKLGKPFKMDFRLIRAGR